MDFCFCTTSSPQQILGMRRFLKRKRGRGAPRKNRFRPVKLRPRERKIVRAAVRSVHKGEQTQREYASWSGAYYIPSVDYGTAGGSYRQCFTFVSNIMSTLSNQASATMNDYTMFGNKIYIKDISFDMLIARGYGTDGSTFNTFPFYVRVDLIRSPLQVQAGTYSGGTIWYNNDGQGTNPHMSLWDGDFTSLISGGGDQYMWGGPPQMMNRRHNKRIFTKIVKMPCAHQAVSTRGVSGDPSGGTSPAVINNDQSVRRMKFKVPIRKRFRFQDPTVGDNNEYGSNYTYYFIMSIAVPTTSCPGTYSSNFNLCYLQGAYYLYFKNLQ